MKKVTVPKISTDQLVEEIIENARDDRDRLIAFAEGLRKFAQRGPVEDEGDDQGMDPDVALALSEQMSKISDSLTKINQQLVTIVQIDAKKQKTEDLSGGPLSQKDKENLYEAMEERKN